MQKKRLDGIISRRNILEKEVRYHHGPMLRSIRGKMLMFEKFHQIGAAKARMQILLTKSINDDLVIQALTIELAATRQVTLLQTTDNANLR